MDKKSVLIIIDLLISASYNSGWKSGFMEGTERAKDETRGVEKYDRKVYEERLRLDIRERRMLKEQLLKELKLGDEERVQEKNMSEEKIKEFLSELVGKGMHTSLRKDMDSKEAGIVWNAIYDLRDGEWEHAVDRVVTEIMKRFTIELK